MLYEVITGYRGSRTSSAAAASVSGDQGVIGRHRRFQLLQRIRFQLANAFRRHAIALGELVQCGLVVGQPTALQDRITSYNVCYTKLLRHYSPDDSARPSDTYSSSGYSLNLSQVVS